MRRIPIPRVGCSGWNYKSWRGPFYPKELAAPMWLSYYLRHFDTVEVNNTFYRLPERSVFEGWRARTPSRFLMAVKASRFLTHMKRLTHPREPLERLLSRVTALDGRLGPILYQLPARFTLNVDRLDTFLRALPRTWERKRLLHVMEFRDPSWYVPEIFQMLEARHVALCLHDKLGSEIVEPVVGPFVYVRFHGTTGAYRGSYSSRQLDRWARRLVEHAQDGRRVFAYFNNDPDAVAVRNALTLRAAIENV